jgi:catechol 2,3-dioxygenase-like lactoylglutathione lyase family enzyme
MGWFLQEVVEMTEQHRIDPRIRAYGKARIDVTRRARDEREWQSMWREPRFAFPFTFGKGWKHSIQYRVEDFAAEIGFYIDVLGFPVSAFSPRYAQFTSPNGDFYFGVADAEDSLSTPPESICLQFMVAELADTLTELEKRDVAFDHKPVTGEDAPAIAVMRSPHGVRIELWGTLSAQLAPQPAVEAASDDITVDFWADDDEDENQVSEKETDDISVEGEATEAETQEAEEEPLDEPVYVDEGEDVSDPLIPVAAAPQEAQPGSRPTFPTIIRRTEDLLKGNLRLPGRKVKGNGLRGFPTTDEKIGKTD